MLKIKEFEKDDIDRVITFERELRKQKPDTYYWEPDAAYRKLLEQSFDDERFRTALSFIAVKEEKVIGRIDASLISSRSDAFCPAPVGSWRFVMFVLRLLLGYLTPRQFRVYITSPTPDLLMSSSPSARPVQRFSERCQGWRQRSTKVRLLTV